VLPRWPAIFVCRSTALRRRALRPQLKRDPLDSGTHPTAQYLNDVFPPV